MHMIYGCSIDGCSKPVGKRMRHCWMHYNRLRRYGDTSPGPARARSQAYAAALADGARGGDECVVWPGPTDRKGYARKGGTLAYHLTWEMTGRRRPQRPLSLDHTCHDPTSCHGGDTCMHRRCVNVDHLRIATPTEQAANSHHRSRLTRQEA